MENVGTIVVDDWEEPFRRPALETPERPSGTGVRERLERDNLAQNDFCPEQYRQNWESRRMDLEDRHNRDDHLFSLMD